MWVAAKVVTAMNATHVIERIDAESADEGPTNGAVNGEVGPAAVGEVSA